MAHVRDPPISLSLSTTGVVGSVGVEVGADVGDSVGDAVLSHVGFVGVCVCVSVSLSVSVSVFEGEGEAHCAHCASDDGCGPL